MKPAALQCYSEVVITVTWCFLFCIAIEKGKDTVHIPIPLDARQVGGMQNIRHLTADPFAQQTKFSVEVSILYC